jgi:preprotein translocase SecE subunit
MASVTNNEKTMASDESDEIEKQGSGDEPDNRSPAPRAVGGGGGGFFTIHKKGQGYWTRLGTAMGAAIIVLFFAHFLYAVVPGWVPLLQSNSNLKIGITAGFLALTTLACWWLMNKSSHVDFLIATDTEMKKVNWTSKAELIGSTKVVIGFMFLIAVVLFILDMYFTRFFYLLGVLVTDAPLWEWVFKGGLGMPGKVALDVVMSVIVFGGAIWAIYGASRKV